MYQSGEVKAMLQRSIDYLGNQSCSNVARSSTSPRLFGEWFQAVSDARDILKDAITSLDSQPVVIIVVDVEAIERRLIAKSIADEDVIGLLPYQAAVGAGDNYFHIVNKSLYEVTTNAHVIPYDETLCARGINTGRGRNGFDAVGVGKFALIPTCPGCLAKAKNQIAYHLQKGVNLR